MPKLLGVRIQDRVSNNGVELSQAVPVAAGAKRIGAGMAGVCAARAAVVSKVPLAVLAGADLGVAVGIVEGNGRGGDDKEPPGGLGGGGACRVRPASLLKAGALPGVAGHSRATTCEHTAQHASALPHCSHVVHEYLLQRVHWAPHRVAQSTH